VETDIVIIDVIDITTMVKYLRVLSLKNNYKICYQFKLFCFFIFPFFSVLFIFIILFCIYKSKNIFFISLKKCISEKLNKIRYNVSSYCGVKIRQYYVIIIKYLKTQDKISCYQENLNLSKNS